MQRLQVHRWVVIFLLVSKLIIGELAHSAAHESQGLADATHVGMVVEGAGNTGELVATCVEGVVRHRATALFRPPA